MKKILAILFYLISSLSIYAEELQFAPINNPIGPLANFFEQENLIYYAQSFCSSCPGAINRYNIETNKSEGLFTFDDRLAVEILGLYNNHLLIRKTYETEDENKQLKYKGLHYNFKEKKIEPDDFVNNAIKLFGNAFHGYFYYQNDLFYIQDDMKYPGVDHRPTDKSKIVFYNYKSDIITELKVHGIIMDMSSDKLHLPIYDEKNYKLILLNTDKNEFNKNFELSFLLDGHFIWDCQFLANNLLLVRSRNNTDYYEEGNYYIVDIEQPKKQIPIKFIIESIHGYDPQPVVYIKIFHGLKKAYSQYYDREKKDIIYTLLDTTTFYDFLNEKGLLFKPCKGTVNAKDVRVRENPNLQAKILTVLAKGTEVEAFERSGIKAQIASTNTYWYKIQLQNGSEGWIYGAFLNLEEKKPEPTKTPEVIG